MKGWTRFRWGLVGLTLLAAALRLAGLGSKSFWFDECFTYTVTMAPLRNSLEALLVAGIYSPLYFLTLRPLAALAGASEYALRWPSAAFSLLCVPLIARLGQRLAGRSVGAMAALLLTVCPFHVWYAQDARMYAPLAFFSLLAMDRFLGLLRGRRCWTAFIVSSGLAYALHYAAFALVYVQLLHLLPRLRQGRLLRRWFLAQALALLPLTPWLALYLLRGIRPAGLGWIPRPGPLAPLLTLWNWTAADVETVTPLVVLAMAATAALLLRGLSGLKGEQRLLLWWLALPLGALYLLSLRRSYYVDRYLTASLPAYLLLLALGANRWRRWLWRVLTFGAVLVTMAWGTLRVHSDPVFAKEGWREAVALVEGQWQAADAVVVADEETVLGTSVYRRQPWTYVVLSRGDAAALLEETAARHGRLWLVWRSTQESNHRLSKSAPPNPWDQAPPPLREWLAAHREQVAVDVRLPGMAILRLDQPAEP